MLLTVLKIVRCSAPRWRYPIGHFAAAILGGDPSNPQALYILVKLCDL